MTQINGRYFLPKMAINLDSAVAAHAESIKDTISEASASLVRTIENHKDKFSTEASDIIIQTASYWRVDKNQQTKYADLLTRNGINDPKIIQATLAAIASICFNSESIGSTLMPMDIYSREQTTDPRHLPERTINLNLYLDQIPNPFGSPIPLPKEFRKTTFDMIVKLAQQQAISNPKRFLSATVDQQASVIRLNPLQEHEFIEHALTITKNPEIVKRATALLVKISLEVFKASGTHPD